MSQTYHLDGMVVRDQDNQYVCEIIAYETDSLNNLLRAPEVLALVQVDRDIKAANLQLLVGKILECNDLYARLGSGECGVDAALALGEAASALDGEIVDLARSLKQ